MAIHSKETFLPTYLDMSADAAGAGIADQQIVLHEESVTGMFVVNIISFFFFAFCPCSWTELLMTTYPTTYGCEGSLADMYAEIDHSTGVDCFQKK